jgi:sirohydrochlorin cobaltochelatase
MESNPSAVIVFAHGSRDARWREPVEAVARRMATLQPDVAVACAYLELVEPDLATAVKRLVDDGARSVHVVPLFLGVGKHVREDLPLLVDDLRTRHRHVVFTLAPAVGETPEVIDVLARVALRG